MAFYKYTGTETSGNPITYPSLDVTVYAGRVVDFGNYAPPSDGKWTSDPGPATAGISAPTTSPARVAHSGGVSANRPSAPSYGEGFWYSTDTASYDYSDGTTWTTGAVVQRGTLEVNVKAFGAKGDGATDDTTAIQTAITSLVSTGGAVFFPKGTYLLSAGVTVAAGGILLRGEGYASALKATGTITNLITFSVSASRGSRGGVYQMRLLGNNQASWGVKLDSWHSFRLEQIEANDLTGGLVDIISDQSGYTENVVVDHCDVRPSALAIATPAFGRVRSGAVGSCTEVVFRDCSIQGLTGWGITLDDVQRCTVDGFVAANNSANFSGAVFCTNSNTATGSPAYAGYHKIDQVYCENNFAGGTAICVQVQAPASATKQLKGIVVDRAAINPETGRTLLNVATLSGTGGLVRDSIFRDPRTPSGGTSNIVIGANVVHWKLSLIGDNQKIATMVSDSGTNTIINNCGSGAYGAAGTPTATVRDIGDIVTNTDDSTVWILDKTNTMRKLA